MNLNTAMPLIFKMFRPFTVICFFSLLLIACRRDTFPTIQDGPALVQECAALLVQFPEGEIPKAKWPRSIAALHPIRVLRQPDDIQIWLYEQRGKFAGGYDVFANPLLAPSNQGVWVQKTAFKGVYLFKINY